MQAQGSSTSLRIGKETSFGVTGATSYEVPFAPTLDIKETQALNDSSVIRGTRSMDRSFLGFKSVDGSLTVPVDTKAFPKFLEAFFGAPTTTGSSPYTHTFKINNTTIPSLFAEVAHKDWANICFIMESKQTHLKFHLVEMENFLQTLE